MSSGLDGGNGTNINLLTILEIILENRLQYILLGWVRTDNIILSILTHVIYKVFTPAGYFQLPALVWLFFFMVCSLWITISVLKRFVVSRLKSKDKLNQNS